MKNITIKFCLLGTVLTVLSLGGQTISDLDKQISALINEAKQLNKKPIVVWGNKQEGLSETQKNATSRYNVNIAQTNERKKFKTKVVITLNPEYICPKHNCPIKNAICEKGGNCKAVTRIGTANFCNLGQEYDLSYRSWDLLRQKMDEGKVQERRLTEIENEIKSLKAQQAELKKAAMEKKQSKSK